MPFIILIVILILLSFSIRLWLYKNRDKSTKSLRNKYLKKLNLPRSEGEEIMERQLESARKKFPNRSEKWYLEKIIYDLDRDR